MATKKPEEVIDSSDGNDGGSEEKFVTRSELMDVLKEFFGDRGDDDDDVIDLDDDDKGDEPLGVYSVKEMEKMIERQVAKITKSLAATKPKAEGPKPKIEHALEEKPVTPDMRGVMERVKTKLWGE